MMFTIHKRTKEEDALQCGECSTVWKESWVDRQGYQKNVITCPMCNTYFDPTDCEIVHYKATQYVSVKISGLLRHKISLEMTLAEADGGKINKESSSLAVKLNTVQNLTQLELARVEDRLRKLIDIPEIQQFPRTVFQNCRSHGVTIKPQIDWLEFEIVTTLHLNLSY